MKRQSENKAKTNSQTKKMKRPKPRRRRRKSHKMIGVLSVVFLGILFFVALGFAFHYYGQDTTRALWWGVSSAVCAVVGIGCYIQAFVIKPDKPKSVETAERHAETRQIKELRGLLRPGNEPTPKQLCGGIKEGWVAVMFGSATMTTPKPYQCLLKIDEDEVLWFEKTSDGMYVNAIIQNERGEEVARVTKNAVQVRPESGYYAEMPDPHTLFILTPDNQKAFYVRYINPSLMKVLGSFYHHGEGPYIIEEGKTPPGLQIDKICFWIEGGGCLIVYDSSELRKLRNQVSAKTNPD